MRPAPVDLDVISDPDAVLERRIDAARRRLVELDLRDPRAVSAALELAALVCARSPSQVVRMERRRGLR